MAYSPGSNGTWQRMMREVVRKLKAMFQEGGARVDQVDGLGAGGAVGSEHCVLGAVCKHTVLRDVPSISCFSLDSSSGGEWKLDVMDAVALQCQVNTVVNTQTLLHKVMNADKQHKFEVARTSCQAR